MDSPKWMTIALLAFMLTACGPNFDGVSPEAIDIAKQGINTNDEWTPVIQTINGLRMALVPAGCFQMGSSDEQLVEAQYWCDRFNGVYGCKENFSVEQPAHTVCFDEPFYIDQNEVSNRAYGEMAGNDLEQIYPFDRDWSWPRETISWEEAEAFCEERGARLPTEAEWEYAARGPDALIYPWGNVFDPMDVNWLMNIPQEDLPKDEDISWWHKPFFAGEVEPCINGRVVTIGAYFGEDMQPVVDRLLGEQMADGGWNCDQEQGSTRGSFHTTINVLEGLLEFERAVGSSPTVAAARERGHEYLLARNLFKRLSTGEPILKDRKEGLSLIELSYPAGWRYDILRALDYLRNAGVQPDPRMADAIEVIKSKRDVSGRWALGVVHEDEPVAEPGVTEGEPSRWITLRALRVLEWYSKVS